MNKTKNYKYLDYATPKEQHILQYLYGYSTKFIVCKDKKGNTVEQTKTYDGNIICSYPDIEVYTNETQTVMIALIEVKGFLQFPRRDLPFDTDLNILAIKENQLKSYIKVQKEEQTNINIIFVVGYSPDEYAFYWESLDNILAMECVKKTEWAFFQKKIVRFYDASLFRRDIEYCVIPF